MMIIIAMIIIITKIIMIINPVAKHAVYKASVLKFPKRYHSVPCCGIAGGIVFELHDLVRPLLRPLNPVHFLSHFAIDTLIRVLQMVQKCMDICNGDTLWFHNLQFKQRTRTKYLSILIQRRRSCRDSARDLRVFILHFNWQLYMHSNYSITPMIRAVCMSAWNFYGGNDGSGGWLRWGGKREM